jgi:UDP-glucose 4-epimerase
MAESYYKEHGIPVLIVRIFNTIGPKQSGYYGMVVPRFVQQAVDNQPITIFGDGSQTRAFCDVRDLVHILTKLAITPRAYGKVINVGNDQSTTILELATLVKSLAKSSSPITHTPISEAYNTDYIEMPHRKPNLAYLKTFIDSQYEWTLKKTIENLIQLKSSR